MSFELFQEGGPLKAKKTGSDQYSMSVSIPKDEDGRVARECPNQECSPSYFKVTPGTGIPAAPHREAQNLCRHSRLALPERVKGSLLIATMKADPIPPVRGHNPDDATSFIRLNALRPASGIAAKVQGKK